MCTHPEPCVSFLFMNWSWRWRLDEENSVLKHEPSKSLLRHCPFFFSFILFFPRLLKNVVNSLSCTCCVEFGSELNLMIWWVSKEREKTRYFHGKVLLVIIVHRAWVHALCVPCPYIILLFSALETSRLHCKAVCVFLNEKS